MFIIIRKVVKICMNDRNDTNKTGAYSLNMKGYAKAYLIVAIIVTVFVGILIFFVGDFSENGKIVVVMIFAAIAILLYVVGYLLSRWNIEFSKQGITYSNIWGKVRSYSYNRISKVIEDEKQNLIVYFDDSQKLLIEKALYTARIFEVLASNRIIIQKKYSKDAFKLNEQNSAYVIYGVSIFFDMVLLVISLVGRHVVGQIVFGMALLFLLFMLYGIAKSYAYVDKQSVFWKKFMHKEARINFSDISHIQFKTESSELRICIYAKDGRVIKIPKGWMNTDLLEEVIKDHGWPVEKIKGK